MKGGVPEDHHVACTSKKVFRMKEAEWSGRSHESIENYAAASLPNLDLGEFSLHSRASGAVASSWESHSQVKEEVAGESSEDAEAVGDFLHKQTRASGNTGGRFGGDGSGGNGPEAVKEALMTGPGIWNRA